MLGLLFGEKAGEGDDVGVDLLLGQRRSVTICMSHGIDPTWQVSSSGLVGRGRRSLLEILQYVLSGDGRRVLWDEKDFAMGWSRIVTGARFHCCSVVYYYQPVSMP